MITLERLSELVTHLAIENQNLKQENDRRTQENDRRTQENDRIILDGRLRLQETERMMQKTDLQISRLEQQIGGLGNKFGSFTEGLAFDSMKKILHDQFNALAVTPRYHLRQNGASLEVDVFAYRIDPDPAVFIVEVKSHLRQQHIEQTLRIIKRFPEMDAWHADKPIYGILAGVDIPKELPEQVWSAGLYLARISGDQFQISVPKGFEPRRFN
jgi:hypothetical protein